MKLTDEQQNMVSKNHNLIYHYAKKHNLDLETYYDVLAIALCKAVCKYNPEKAKFATYACTCMRNEVYMYWRDHRRKIETVTMSYDGLGFIPEDCNDVYEGFETEIININEFESFVKKLNDFDKKIIEGKLEGKTQTAIAKELNVSQTTITKHLAKIKLRYESR